LDAEVAGEGLSLLAVLCRSLNRSGVRYVLVGGYAVILHGYSRTTQDIDLLVDPAPENIGKLRQALYETFGEEAVFEIRDGDIQTYTVIRFVPESGEIAVDLIGRIGEVDFWRAASDVEEIEVEGVKVPVCGLETLIETKRGARTRDQEDLMFLLGKREFRRRRGR